jgi:hypothetical protein
MPPRGWRKRLIEQVDEEEDVEISIAKKSLGSSGTQASPPEWLQKL